MDYNFDIKSKSIVICSIIKNEEKNLKKYFNTIESITKCFKKHFIILVESDSKDNTPILAKKLISKYNGVVIETNTDHLKFRTEKISFCRNKYLNYINKNKNLQNFDLLIVADVDQVNSNINFKKIENSISTAPKDWVGIFAYQKFIYYDVWPLRIKNHIENDCYQDFIKLSETNSTRKAYYLAVFKKFFLIKKFKDKFIKVKSAFGGFGIYKLKEVLDIEYDSSSGIYSEHVLFNKKILENNINKSLYIDKKLINFSGINEHFLKGITYSVSNHFSKKLLEKFKIMNKKK
jgi:hypothetical protein